MCVRWYVCGVFWKYLKICEINIKVIVILYKYGKKLYNNYVFEIFVLVIDFKIKFVIVFIISREMY